MGPDLVNRFRTLIQRFSDAIRLPVVIALAIVLGGVPIVAQDPDGAKNPDGATESPHPESALSEPPITKTDRDHWAFRPLTPPSPPEGEDVPDVPVAKVKDVPVPEVEDASWSRRPLDRFVLAKLESESLRPAGEADRSTLLRRLWFDVTGLPPDLQRLQTFLADDRPDAYRRAVDAALASPEYGQRWAQHWLDLARFAETDGFEHDKVRENAWRYRDWVIRALNDDMPYDRFVRLQVAGDLIEPGNEDAAVATSFCLSGPDMPDINSQVERKHLLLNEIASTVGSVFLSLQVGCAQCHDHKFDPISQADFYRLRAYFDPAIDLKRNRSVTDLSAGRVKPTMQFVAIRGDWRRPGPAVSPNVVRIASTRSVTRPDNQSVGERDAERESDSENDRVALASWLSSAENPLTARSIVNRVWQHHFGKGLSGTPSDFGVMGDEPSHRELLDYLASELVRRDWRLKDLHREILLSATYRTRSFRDSDRASSRGGDAGSSGRGKLAGGETDDTWERLVRSDPNNRLLGRYPRRRLEGEVIRDAMFAVSGSLSRAAGGPGVMPPLPVELKQTLLRGQWSASKLEADHYRRSVYLFARRNLPYPMFATFDRPSANTSCAARDSSTTAPQALYLFNSSVTIDAATRLAELLRRHHPVDRNGQIDEAYRRLFSRAPDAEELRHAAAFLREAEYGRAGTGGDADGPTPLVELCRALLNANPFLYID